eukprot:CAMPEP_0119499478 /NCGR_PEP_ID=MMETSP1344-20130328/21917_1 /TAXON_ID=236787 /ORGANISM="Florenciella parvula, Strain CCMP2471" /LENGTH=297 /DNA_ID=CAMNT_0007535473 /DNA_START=214 /DNA_END=1107 /DNA_ORIENTATION=+
MSALGNLFGDGESDDDGQESTLTIEELDTWGRVTVAVTADDAPPDGAAAEGEAASSHIPQRAYQLVQASAAFSGFGEDETGSVLWGAALHLARLLHTRRADWLKPVDGSKSPDRSTPQDARPLVLELGCGCALASLVANDAGCQVIASDYNEKILQQARYNFALNNCDPTSGPRAIMLDWNDAVIADGGAGVPANLINAADVVFGSDLIYGMQAVVPLATIIQECTRVGGLALVATRDGRRGVAEFVELMREANEFEEEETIPLASSILDMPEVFKTNAQRWHAHHTIYVWRRKETV